MDRPSEVSFTEIELLKIFPEAKEIIPQKIHDWQQVKNKIYSDEILPVLQKIVAVKDTFSRWFWLTVFITCYQPEEYVQAVKHLSRLNRLKLFTTDGKAAATHETFARNKEQAKQRSILELHDFQNLRKIGQRYQACCPFHKEKTPSFVIYPNNSFYCFGCHAHGDVIDFMKILKKCDFKEAVSTLVGVPS